MPRAIDGANFKIGQRVTVGGGKYKDRPGKVVRESDEGKHWFVLFNPDTGKKVENEVDENSMQPLFKPGDLVIYGDEKRVLDSQCEDDDNVWLVKRPWTMFVTDRIAEDELVKVYSDHEAQEETLVEPDLNYDGENFKPGDYVEVSYSSMPPVRAQVLRKEEKKHQPALKPAIQPALKPAFQPALKPAIQPTGHSILRPAHEPAHEAAHEPAHHPTHQPTVQPIYQSTQQPVHRSVADSWQVEVFWGGEKHKEWVSKEKMRHLSDLTTDGLRQLAIADAVHVQEPVESTGPRDQALEGENDLANEPESIPRTREGDWVPVTIGVVVAAVLMIVGVMMPPHFH